MTHVVEVVLVDAVVKHLDQVPHKSPMHQARICGIVAADKNLESQYLQTVLSKAKYLSKFPHENQE